MDAANILISQQIKEMKMQGSKTDSFVKSVKKQRRFDDGLTKQSNVKKGKFSPKRNKERGEYDH